MPFGRRSLFHDRVRVAMSAGALAFAVLLVLLLRGIMDGTVQKSTSYIDHVGADVFVATSGVTNMALAASTLPESSVETLSEQPGVARAGGILRINAIVSTAQDSRPGILIGYDPDRSLGGPWKLSRGRGVEATDETVLDTELAKELHVSLGSEVSIAGGTFRVVGLSTETAAIAGKLAFVHLQRAQEILRLPAVVSFVLLDLAPGVNREAFVSSLAAASSDIEVLTRETLSRNDRKLLARLFVQPINVMSTIGLLVGLAIVGLTMYTTTAERLHDFGVLKAIGAPNQFLLATVASQAIYLGAGGFVLGLAGAWAVGPVIVRLVPDIGVLVTAKAVGQALAAVFTMSLVGAVGPLVRILRVDPLLVFKR